MIEYLDQALDYLKGHKLVAASLAVLFFVLLLKNFWFLIKLIIILAIAVVVVFFAYSFVGDAIKRKEDFLRPGESSLYKPPASHAARQYRQV